VQSVVAPVDASWGELRAMVAARGFVHLLFARPVTNRGVLARVPSAGGDLTLVAEVGLDPVALAVGESATFIATRGDAKIFRVAFDGTVRETNAAGAPSALATFQGETALWALPFRDEVFAWNLATGAPSALASFARVTAIDVVGGDVFMSGNGSLGVYTVGVDATPRKIADECERASVASDGSFACCSYAGALFRVDVSTNARVRVATTAVDAVPLVLGANRLVFSEPLASGRPQTKTLRLDRADAVQWIDGDSGVLAADGCDLYSTTLGGRMLVRLAF
jgi:hypothetical protein